MDDLNSQKNNIVNDSKINIQTSTHHKNAETDVKPNKNLLMILVTGFTVSVLSDIAGFLAGLILTLLFTATSCSSSVQGFPNCLSTIVSMAWIFLPITALGFMIYFSHLFSRLLAKRNQISLTSKQAFWAVFAISLILDVMFIAILYR